jgi:hypothetical protein
MADKTKDNHRTSTNGITPGLETASAPGPIGESGQHSSYWVLSEDERAKGFVRPVRRSYVHTKCGSVTTMSTALAETYARNPTFYGATFCCACKTHSPVSEFVWDKSSEVVGS